MKSKKYKYTIKYHAECVDFPSVNNEGKCVIITSAPFPLKIEVLEIIEEIKND